MKHKILDSHGNLAFIVDNGRRQRESPMMQAIREVKATAKRLNPLQQRAVDYIWNASTRATIANFDDDHAPIGPDLRRELKELDVYHIVSGNILVLNPPYEP